jgi:hypothetical protein
MRNALEAWGARAEQIPCSVLVVFIAEGNPPKEKTGATSDQYSRFGWLYASLAAFVRNHPKLKTFVLL